MDETLPPQGRWGARPSAAAADPSTPPPPASTSAATAGGLALLTAILWLASGWSDAWCPDELGVRHAVRLFSRPPPTPGVSQGGWSAVAPFRPRGLHEAAVLPRPHRPSRGPPLLVPAESGGRVGTLQPPQAVAAAAAAAVLSPAAQLWAQLADTLATLSQVAVLAGSGFALRRSHILDKASTKALSQMTVTALLPCFLLTRLAPLRPEQLLRSWGLSLGLFVLTVFGLLIGAIASKWLKVPERYARSFTTSCAFGNNTSLGIILVSSIVGSASMGGFYTEAEAMAVLAMALPVQHIMMWLVAYNYVKGALFPKPADPATAEALLPGKTPAALAGRPPPGLGGAVRRVAAVAAALVNPPLLGIALGIAVSCIAPLRLAWTAPGGSLRWLAASLERLGSAVVPISMMTLGSNLSEGPGEGMERKPIAAMFVIRQLIMPLLGIATVFALSALRVFPAHDALPPLVLMVLASAPTANNMVTIATALGAGAAEISTCVFWQYVGFLGLQMVYIPLFISVARHL